MLIATPSFALLYSIDEVVDPVITLKAVGHQWYWHYENTNKCTGNKIYKEEMRLAGDRYLRLLDTDKRILLPVSTSIRLLVTSVDVLHSWAVPSLGIKIDACPGRLNQTSFFIKRSGLFYGQCSEICGTGHGFMPIALRALPLSDYLSHQGSQNFLNLFFFVSASKKLNVFSTTRFNYNFFKDLCFIPEFIFFAEYKIFLSFFIDLNNGFKEGFLIKQFMVRHQNSNEFIFAFGSESRGIRVKVPLPLQSNSASSGLHGPYSSY